MVRFVTVFSVLFLIPRSLMAEGTDPRITTALAIQTAMSRAKEHLQAHRPADAVAVLEAEILHVNGNSNYLALMKDAYVASLKDLKAKNADPERIDHVIRQLRTLDPTLKAEEIAPSLAVAAVPAKPIVPMVEPKPETDDFRKAPALIVRAKSEGEDPFQQAPLDRQPAKADFKSRAAAAYAHKNYVEAAALFAQARNAGSELSSEEKQAWGYCQLHAIGNRLNKKDADLSLPSMERETEAAIKLGGAALDPFGQSVLAEIRKRKASAEPPAPTAIPEGWQAVDTGSFRIFFQQSQQQAIEIGKAAEQIRSATFEKWSGPAGADWSPHCDLWLHANPADYTKATSKPAASFGYASVGMKAGKVTARRIDLRLDDAGLMEITLPREVAYVVVSDLFHEQPLPRWADVGMTTLAEPPAEISRYRRAVPKLAQERKLFSLRELLKMAEFPEAEKITPFYVESVSLVDFLVQLKGPKAFALYLREAPRRGYEEALQRHYGFKDANELQVRWMKFAMGNE